jgi:hypothetical protein
MILSKYYGFGYVRVPKTGSTSFIKHLINNIQISKLDFVVYAEKEIYNTMEFVPRLINKVNNFQHPELDTLIDQGKISLEELSKLELFGVVRNPVDRFFSSMFYGVGHLEYAKDDLNLNIDNTFYKEDINYITKFVIENVNWNTLYFLPQIYWLTYKNKYIDNIFTYDNLYLMVKEIFKICNINTDPNIPYKIRSETRPKEFSLSQIDKRIVDQIKEIYYDDVIIYEQLRKQGK